MRRSLPKSLTQKSRLRAIRRVMSYSMAICKRAQTVSAARSTSRARRRLMQAQAKVRSMTQSLGCTTKLELERLMISTGCGAAAKGRKREMMTDTLGFLLFAVILSADIQDRDGAPGVIRALRHRFPWLRHVFADGGYAGNRLSSALRGHGDCTIEIINRFDTASGFELLPRRWVVERTFAWLGRCRRLAKDWEKSLESSNACTLIAASGL